MLADNQLPIQKKNTENMAKFITARKGTESFHNILPPYD